MLMIAHTYPPARDVGVRRTAAFARYLPQFGWQPVVVTVRESLPELAPGADGDGNAPGDPNADAVDTPVIRTRWLHPRLLAARLRRPGMPAEPAVPAGAPWRWVLRALVLIPDEAVGWIPFALPAALRAVSRYGCDAIYTTSGPPSAHLIGWLLKARTGLPWVADFRDPWTSDLSPIRRRIYAFPGRRRLDEWLEAGVLARADKVLAVSEPQRDVLKQSSPPSSDSKFEVLPNGFDPDHFEGLEHGGDGLFTLTYTGTLYLEEQSLDELFQTIAALRASGDLPAGGFRFRYLGRSGERVLRAARAAKTEDLVTVEEPVPFRESLRAQVDATALLLVLGSSQGRQGVLTGKLFEYLGSRRPILALVPAGSAAADIVRETEAGTVVSASDRDAMERVLSDMFAEFSSTGDLTWKGSEAAVQRYSRAAQTERLAGILDGVTRRAGSSRVGV